jgi:hypothetical protein
MGNVNAIELVPEALGNGSTVAPFALKKVAQVAFEAAA